jgi:hypothetical protein
MFKNIPSKTLLYTFGALLTIAVIFIYYDSTHEERTFVKDIVDIDTSSVSAISLFPKVTNHKEVKLYKEGNYWFVQLDNNKSVQADYSKVKNLLDQLSQIKSNGVAAQGENKWSEFKVDTSGTRVQVYEGSSVASDIIIGKFTFQQPRTAVSYVRLKGDKIIYEVNGFLEFTFNQKPNDFRNSYIVNDDFTNWKRLTFSYPADSSFQLVKDTSGYWTINNLRTDSVKTVNALRNLSHLSSTNFVDDYNPSLLGKPTYSLTIESSTSGAIRLVSYSDPTYFIIHSTQNSEAYFNGNANSLWQKIFLGKSSFLKK